MEKITAENRKEAKKLLKKVRFKNFLNYSFLM